MLRKLLIFKCVLLLTFFSLTSQAALQWDVAAFISTGTAIVVTGLAMVSAAPIIISGVLAVGFHAAVIGLYWNDASPPLLSNGSVGVSSISVILDPNTPLVKPAGYTQGSLTMDEPIPPAATITLTNYSVDLSRTLSCGTACSALQEEFLGDLSIVVMSFVDANYSVDTAEDVTTDFDRENSKLVYRLISIDGVVDGSVAVNFTKAKCPTGYKLNSSYTNTCDLVDANLTKKPADGMCEFRRANGVFTKSAVDPDCDSVTVTGSGTTTLSAVTAGRSVYLATAADDKVSVYTKEYNAQSGQTITTVANLSSAQIVSLISQTVAAGDTTAVAPVAGGGSGTGTTDGTALDSSLQVKEGGDEVLGDNTSITQGVSAPAMFGSTFDPLKAWTIPLNAGACPVGSFEVFNKTFNFDAQCALFAQYLPEIKASMGVFYTFTALIIVLGA
jgi:hypothetical protein